MMDLFSIAMGWVGESPCVQHYQPLPYHFHVSEGWCCCYQLDPGGVVLVDAIAPVAWPEPLWTCFGNCGGGR